MTAVDTRELIEAGLYDPDAPRADERLALLEFLIERGATVDEMVAAHQTGALIGVAGELHRRGTEALMTARELADAVDMTVEQVVAVSRAAGLPTADVDLPAYHPLNVEAFLAVRAGHQLFGEDPILQFTRAMGAALASVADAAMALFGINVTPRLDAEGATELERAQTVELASAMLVEDVPQAMTALFRGHVDAAVRRSVASDSDAAHVAELTVGFLDLTGSTHMVQALAPHELAAAIAEFEKDAMELVAEREGRVVKTIGDEVMFVTTTSAAACDVALELQELVRRHNVLTSLSGGIAAGGLVRGYGDFYGPEVNRAARIVKLAQPGTILVTGAVRERALDDGGYRFEPAGEHALAGFDDPTIVFRLERV